MLVADQGFDLGAFLVQSKWNQVRIGLPRILGALATSPKLTHPGEGEAAQWYALFGLAGELLEALELMDDRSFGRLIDEVGRALSHLTPTYMNTLVDLVEHVEHLEHSSLRYRFLAAGARDGVRTNRVTFPPRQALESKDEQLDKLELDFLASTCIARFVFVAFEDRDGWSMKRILLNRCGPAVGPLQPGDLAVDVNFRPDSQGLPVPIEVKAVALSGGKWLTRPSALTRRPKLTTTPPVSGFLARFRNSELRDRVHRLMSGASTDARRVTTYFNALDHDNDSLLLGPDPFPDTSCALSRSQFDNGWANLAQTIKPGDALFSRWTKDLVSSSIAKADGGAWSHCVIYLGSGQVWEMETTGGDVVPLEDYRNPRYRLGVFRDFQYSADLGGPIRQAAQVKMIRVFAERWRGRPYSYRGALLAGLVSFLDNSPPGNRSTPNALIRSGRKHPVVIV